MAPAKKAQKFYAIHGTPKIYTKWIGPGGAQERTAGHSRLTFHGFLERAAAEYYLTIPNAAAAQEWANAHGKSKQWREHAPPIVQTVDHSDLPPFKEFLQFCPGLTKAPPPQLPTPPPPFNTGGFPAPIRVRHGHRVRHQLRRAFHVGPNRRGATAACATLRDYCQNATGT